MKCPNCGKEIAENSQFCEFCGTKINLVGGDNVSNYDDMCLQIIYVGSKHDAILASYKARKKCYKIAKVFEKRYDYKEHVQKLQIDNFPDEFKKSIIGESYRRTLIWSIIGVVIFLFFSLLGWGMVFDGDEDFLWMAIPSTCLLVATVVVWVKYSKKLWNKFTSIHDHTA